MAELLIIAHAPLASALRRVAQHVFPERAHRLACLDVTGEESFEAVEARLKASLPSSGEVLILTDVFGATPCNVAMRVADGQRARVVTGVNVPMLWRALGYVDEPLDNLVARAVAGATQGVMQLATTRPQNQSQKAAPDDSSDSQDQQ